MVSRALSALLSLSVSLAFVGCDIGTADESDLTSTLKEDSVEAQAVRAMLNDPATTKASLVKAKVPSTAATALMAHRDGADGALRTADDDPFDTIKEVDAVKGIGASTLKKLVSAASAGGYVDAEKAKVRKVIFSPQAAAESHNAEIAKIIQGAKHSIDIAMYSYSDAGIGAALADAVKRG